VTTVIVIPARIESTRLPGKVLADIGGKPMIQHVWERCKQVPEAASVLIATNSAVVARAAVRFGAAVALTPPWCWSGSHRIAVLSEKVEADLYVDVQADLPLADPAAISHLIMEAVSRETDAVGLIAPTDRRRAPKHVVKTIRRRDGSAMFFSRGLDSPWAEVGVYAFSRRALETYLRESAGGESVMARDTSIEQLAFLEYGVTWECAEWPVSMLSVDTPRDLRLAREEYARASASTAA